MLNGKRPLLCKLVWESTNLVLVFQIFWDTTNLEYLGYDQINMIIHFRQNVIRIL